jgi:hypothetical protein
MAAAIADPNATAEMEILMAAAWAILNLKFHQIFCVTLDPFCQSRDLSQLQGLNQLRARAFPAVPAPIDF